MNTLRQDLNWRYATKAFDSSKKLTKEQLADLLWSARYAPSSSNFQPWSFVVVENPELRKKLRAAAYDQAQLTDASHVIVLCQKTNVDAKHVQHVVDNTAKDYGVQAASLAGLQGMMSGILQAHATDLDAWTARQTYIAFGFLLTMAAHMHIDACPMEGFDAAEFDAILGLKAKNLHVLAACAVGFRAESDKYAKSPKSRLPESEVVITME